MSEFKVGDIICIEGSNIKHYKYNDEKIKEKYLDEAIKEWESIPMIQRISKDEFSFYDGYLACAAKFENQKLD